MQNRRRSSRCVNVVIPSGVHGGPVTSGGGPSSLTERWKSGGLCDCGGWDVGCPITVLTDSTMVSETSPHKESQECNSIDLFMEGAKHGEPAFRLLNVGEDLFLVRFKSTLSALQCFSIGVATVHAQASQLNPKL
uniref:Uncharacterized protein n=1 Tax=Ananas comosus var. bracteatus TaxID=296719 RepID=A0A6V7PZ13_ANACO|nr:unnamed protein product [Ananas comosus var. bracteatus]